jgi:hypothetical protein
MLVVDVHVQEPGSRPAQELPNLAQSVIGINTACLAGRALGRLRSIDPDECRERFTEEEGNAVCAAA